MNLSTTLAVETQKPVKLRYSCKLHLHSFLIFFAFFLTPIDLMLLPNHPNMINDNVTSNGYIQDSEKVPSLAPPATISVTDVPLKDSGPPDHALVAFQSDGQDDQNFGVLDNTLTEPIEETIKRDLLRVVSNLKLVVLPNPFREDPGKALRDWDLWGPFFFIVFLGMALSWSASIEKADVFAVAFGGFALGAVVLTFNIVLLVHQPSLFWQTPSDEGGRINFFQSISLLGYCLFPLDIGALLCLMEFNLLFKLWIVLVALGWSCWAAYPFMSTAVHQNRKALALYPVLLTYVSVALLITAIA